MDKFEALTKYKQLLDQGVITQDEYDELKRNLLRKNAIHEHLSIGARVASNSFGSLRKKTEDTYGLIKEKGNQWIEKELEKERINEDRKKILKEKQEQTKQYNNSAPKKDNEYRLTKVKYYAKKTLVIIMITVLIIIAAFTALFLFREKVSFSADSTDSVHGLEYSVSKEYKKEKGKADISDDNVIKTVKDAFEIYDKSNLLIAAYSIEYLGEDIDIDKYKERICRSLSKHTVTQSDNLITIDGYYKEDNLSIQNITKSGLVKQRVLLCVKDYSCFMVVFKCNAWNYSEKTCNQLFDAVKIKQYKNSNTAEKLNITYKGSNKSGYKPVKDDFKVEVQYKNGKRSQAEVYKLQVPKQLSKNDNQVMIECHGIKSILNLRSYDEDSNLDNGPRTDELEKKDDSPFDEGGQQA